MKYAIIAITLFFTLQSFGASLVMKSEGSAEKYGMKMVDLLTYASGERWKLPKFVGKKEVKPNELIEGFFRTTGFESDDFIGLAPSFVSPLHSSNLQVSYP